MLTEEKRRELFVKKTNRQKEILANVQKRNLHEEVDFLYDYYRYYSGCSHTTSFREFYFSEGPTILKNRYRRNGYGD